jgi:hypothetical protein
MPLSRLWQPGCGWRSDPTQQHPYLRCGAPILLLNMISNTVMTVLHVRFEIIISNKACIVSRLLEFQPGLKFDLTLKPSKPELGDLNML